MTDPRQSHTEGDIPQDDADDPTVDAEVIADLDVDEADPVRGGRGGGGQACTRVDSGCAE